MLTKKEHINTESVIHNRVLSSFNILDI